MSPHAPEHSTSAATKPSPAAPVPAAREASGRGVDTPKVAGRSWGLGMPASMPPGRRVDAPSLMRPPGDRPCAGSPGQTVGLASWWSLPVRVRSQGAHPLQGELGRLVGEEASQVPPRAREPRVLEAGEAVDPGPQDLFVPGDHGAEAIERFARVPAR